MFGKRGFEKKKKTFKNENLSISGQHKFTSYYPRPLHSTPIICFCMRHAKKSILIIAFEERKIKSISSKYERFRKLLFSDFKIKVYMAYVWQFFQFFALFNSNASVSEVEIHSEVELDFKDLPFFSTLHFNSVADKKNK